jgi:hypothetical protein
MRIFKFVFFTKQGDQMHTKVWSETLKERDHVEDAEIGGRIILKCILSMLGQFGLDSSGLE